MIYCFTANNRTHFFLHVGVLSLFIVDLKLCNRTKRSAKLDMRQFLSAKSELYYSCKEEKEVFINLQSAADKIKTHKGDRNYGKSYITIRNVVLSKLYAKN